MLILYQFKLVAYPIFVKSIFKEYDFEYDTFATINKIHIL